MIEFVFAGLFLYMILLPILINFVPEANGKYKDFRFNTVKKIFLYIFISILFLLIYFYLNGDSREDSTIEFLENRTDTAKVYIDGRLVVNSNYVINRLKRVKRENRNGGNHPLQKTRINIVIKDKNENMSFVLKQGSYVSWEYFIYSSKYGNGHIGVIRNFFNEPISIYSGDKIIKYSTMKEYMNRDKIEYNIKN